MLSIDDVMRRHVKWNIVCSRLCHILEILHLNSERLNLLKLPATPIRFLRDCAALLSLFGDWLCLCVFPMRNSCGCHAASTWVLCIYYSALLLATVRAEDKLYENTALVPRTPSHR